MTAEGAAFTALPRLLGEDYPDAKKQPHVQAGRTCRLSFGFQYLENQPGL